MGEAQQTVERRQLGLALQGLRLRSGKSQQEAGTAIGKAHARISQVENGKGSLKHDDLHTLLDLYQATSDERDTVIAIGLEARRRRPRQAYTDALPDTSHRLTDLQPSASMIRHYAFGVFPGLLQSPDYVRGLIQIGSGVWWTPSSEEVEARIASRLEQQRRVLTASPAKKLIFIFTEDALRNVIGDASVMRGQILHVLQLVERHPELNVQILRSGTVGNPALGGGLVLLDFVAAPRIGYAPSIYGPAKFHDKQADTEVMKTAFERIHELALSPDESRNLLIEHLKEK